MPLLSSGTRLGPYEITGSLGAGGMGEVYRARDTRLNRDVAIKCLSPKLSGDPSSRQRIEREARATASVSHPHICTLFDVGHHDGEMFLVMELLDGRTLAHRIARSEGGLPLAEVMTIATQLADALAVAHRHGLVHRDIKPGNVMITASGAKLLDFGLARPAFGAGDDTGSLITETNERLGTPAYMAPEQLEGHADHRGDIFALGAVMFEMVTGTRASAAGGVAEALRPDTPPGLDRLIRKCLDRDPDRRWQSAADLADELRWIATAPAPAPPQRVPNLWMIAATVFLAAVAVTLIALPRFASRDEAKLEQLSFLVPENVGLFTFGQGLALSPDGSMVAFAGTASAGGGPNSNLFVRRLDSPESRMISGSDGALYPIFSPDSHAVVFFANGKAWKWSLATDAVSPLVNLTGPFDAGSSGSWGEEGVLLFGLIGDRPPDGIRRLSAAGGELTTLTQPDNARRELTHFGPQALPGGRMLFSVRSAGDREAEFKVVMREESGRITTLIPGASQATYLGNNQLAYQTGSTLMLADFDRSAGVLSNPRKVIDGVYATAHGASWAIAGNTLVYRPVEPPRRRLVWVERAGRMTPIDSELRDFSNPKISPSGDRVVTAVQQQNGTRNLWILDLTRQTLTPLTTGAQTMGGLWTSDGSAIAATRTNGAALDVILQAADGSTASRVLLHTGEQNYVADLDATSRLMVVMAQVGKTGRDIAVMDRDDPSTLRYIVETPATEFGGRLSPNGKWLSYFSDTSGRYELWVTPFPQGGPKWQLTRNGAREAVWSHDGRELYFRQGDTMNAITIHDTPTFSWDPAHELFTGVFFQLGGPGNVHYDVAKDGRFLMIQEAPPRTPSFNVVRNWQQLAK